MDSETIILAGETVGLIVAVGVRAGLAMSELREVERSCDGIVERIEEGFRQMPRSQTCVHSEVPNGRTFCNYFGKCCLAYCPKCENFENRYLMER